MDKHAQQPQIEVQDIDHLGIVAGIIDEIGLAEEIDRRVGTHPQEHVSSSQAVKAMILNGLGFVSAPLYLFGEFFSGKATEHLLGEGIKPEHLNDDRLGRVLDKLFEADLTEVFVGIATKAAERFGGPTKSVHLDATSFHLHGRYDDEGKEESEEIRITYGYSREHRPDLKQFVVDLMSTGDGGVPLFLRVANANEADQAVFAELLLGTSVHGWISTHCLWRTALSTVRRTWLLWGTCGGCAGCRVRSGKPGGCWPKPRGQPLWRVTFTKATGSPRLKATTPGWCTVG
jgi:hypothetical protein